MIMRDKGCIHLRGDDMQIPNYVSNTKFRVWVEEMIALCKPDQVHWCDGSQEEYDRLCNQMVESGTFIRLNPQKRPNSFLARSDPSSVKPEEPTRRTLRRASA